ncbi:MAG: M20/M25/M40 family metallo-hydrolase [Candidatus Thermoplasmatota archaeon]
MPGLSPAELLERLVAIPSPTGLEAAAVAFLADEARSDGFRVRSDSAGNFLAEAGRGERLVLFVGHIDTVPGHIPVRVADGVLWGRGAVDAKAPLVAAYCAARAHRDNPDLRIVVAGCIDEEGHSRGAKALPRDLRPEAILVGEPSGADGITIGYKGILRGQFSVEREAQHGGYPGGGAADALVAWWSAVGRDLAFADGFTTCHGRLADLRSGSDGLLDEASASFQVRLPPSVPPAEAQRRIAELAQQNGAEVLFSEAMPAAESSSRSALVARLKTAIRAAGMEPRLKRKTGTADFNHLAQWFPGVPLVAYGPGDSHLDHTPNERIELAELERGVRVLDRTFSLLAETRPVVAAKPA